MKLSSWFFVATFAILALFIVVPILADDRSTAGRPHWTRSRILRRSGLLLNFKIDNDVVTVSKIALKSSREIRKHSAKEECLAEVGANEIFIKVGTRVPNRRPHRPISDSISSESVAKIIGSSQLEFPTILF
jgi:hypothetical protein